LSHYNFREKLVKCLCGIVDDNATVVEENTAEVCEETSSESDNTSLEIHQFAHLSKPSPCIYCKLVYKESWHTTKECRECKAPLCFRDRDCYFKWHSSAFTEERKKCNLIAIQLKVGRPLGSAIAKGKGKRKKKDGRTCNNKAFYKGITNYVCHPRSMEGMVIQNGLPYQLCYSWWIHAWITTLTMSSTDTLIRRVHGWYGDPRWIHVTILTMSSTHTLTRGGPR